MSLASPTDMVFQRVSSFGSRQRLIEDDVLGLGVCRQTKTNSVERTAQLLECYGLKQLVQSSLEIVMIAAQQREEIGHEQGSCSVNAATV